MNFLKRAFNRIFQPAKHIVPPWYGVSLYSGMQEAAKHKALVKRYTGWAFTCVHKNASVVASQKLRAVIDERPIRKNHPLVKLIDNPNPENTWHDILESVQTDMEIGGNGYMLMEFDPVLGIPMRIWPLMGQFVKIIITPSRGVTAYRYGRTFVDQVMLPAKNVLHFRYPNPEHLYSGKGPLEAAILAVDRLIHMAKHSDSFYRNMARPDLLIKADYVPDTPAYDRLMASWEEKFRRQSGKPMVVGTDVDIEPIGYPPKDLAELMISKAIVREIANIFDIPMTMFEITKSRAEAEAGLYQFKSQAVLPRCERITRRLNKELVPLFDDRIKLEFYDVVPEDIKARSEEISAHLTAGYSTVNEERLKDGLVPIEEAPGYEKPQKPVAPDKEDEEDGEG